MDGWIIPTENCSGYTDTVAAGALFIKKTPFFWRETGQLVNLAVE